GSTIQKQNIKINRGVNQLHLNLPALPAGVYYLKLQTKDYTTTQRIIKL
ncbi:MAG: T9SS type A sorting domain-containing protein, partial [Bacteroidetes bacterium]|nr:T9SS type A sorting domain-containing protein [Bacteroidota bacterium]